MKVWVIAPSAAEANTSDRYLPDIEKYIRSQSQEGRRFRPILQMTENKLADDLLRFKLVI